MISSKVINTVLAGVVTIASLITSQVNASAQANSVQEAPWTQALTTVESSSTENSALFDSNNQFSPMRLWSDNFSDRNGWDSSPAYYSTIQFPDINGDGKADMCGRGGAGVNCALSTGVAFGATSLWSDNFSDRNGWDSSPAYYSTIRFPDINGDGKADMCGRGGAGINCALSTGAAFGVTSLWSDNFSDGNGWDSSPAYYSTIRFPDINGDGKADTCGRGGAGVNCATAATSKVFPVYLPIIIRQT